MDEAAVLPPGMASADVTRYSRQMLVPDIGGAGQARISQAKVLVVGAGGLGCSVIPSLAGYTLSYQHIIMLTASFIPLGLKFISRSVCHSFIVSSAQE